MSRMSPAALEGYLGMSGALHRGHIGDNDLQAVRAAGYDDAQIIEIVQHVALNTWTNYINEVAKTNIDFRAVLATQAA
jgi:alkylhydroperoxidase family enzyme